MVGFNGNYKWQTGNGISVFDLFSPDKCTLFLDLEFC